MAGLALGHRVPGCLVPGPEVSGQVDGSPESESLIEEVVGVWSLAGLVCIWTMCSQASPLPSVGIG